MVSIYESGTLLFRLPREHPAEGLAVKVKFRYEWEIDPDGSINGQEPKHYAFARRTIGSNLM